MRVNRHSHPILKSLALFKLRVHPIAGIFIVSIVVLFLGLVIPGLSILAAIGGFIVAMYILVAIFWWFISLHGH